MASIARLVVSLGANISDFETDMKRASALTKRELGKMQKEADRLNKEWNNNFKAAGLGVAAGIGLAIKAAADFEKAMAEVSTLLDDTSGLKRTEEAVKGLAVQFGQAPVDQAKALYQIISAGASDSATQVELLTAANKLAVGGVTDVATAADGLTSVLNAYAGTGLDSARASDILFTTMKQGKTTIGELSSSLGKVVTIAAQTGVSFEEIGASVGTITKAGIGTSEAMSALRGVLSAVLKQSSESIKVAKELGVQFDVAAIKTKGFAGFLADIADSGATEAQLSKLFGQVEGLTAVMAIGANNAEEFTRQLDAQAKSAGATDEAVSKMMENTAFKADQARVAFETLGIEIGERFLSSVSGMATLFVENIDKMTRAVEIMVAYITGRATIAVVASFGEMAAAGSLAARTMAFLGGSVGASLTALGAVAAIVYNNTEQANRMNFALDALSGSLEEATAKWKENASAAELAAVSEAVIQSQADAVERIGIIAERMAQLRENVGAATDQLEFNAEYQQLTKELEQFTQAINDADVVLSAIKKTTINTGSAISDFVKDVIGAGNATKDTGKEVLSLADKLKKLGTAEVKSTQATRELAEHYEKLHEEYVEGKKKAEDYARALQDFIDIGNPVAALVRDFEAQIKFANEALAAGRITVEQYQATLNKLSDALGKAAAGTVDVVEQTDFMREAMLEGVRIITREFSDMWSDILSGGEGAFDSLVDGFRDAISAMANQISTSGIAEQLENLFSGNGKFDSKSLIGSLIGTAGILGGSILGGGGANAGLGSGLGGLLGQALGSKFLASLGTFAGPIGTAIGAILGGLLGGLFDKDRPLVLETSGFDTSRLSKSDTDSTVNTAFGTSFIRSRRVDAAALAEYSKALEEFDNGIASFLDDAQIGKITDTLKSWSSKIEGETLTVEQLLNSRFAAILSTFSDQVQDFVNQSTDLQERASRLQIGVGVEKLFADQPDLFSGRTVAQFLAVVDAFRDGTEDITQTFQRLVAILDIVVAATGALKEFSSSSLKADYEALVRLQNETPTTALSRMASELSDAIFLFSGAPEDLLRIAELTQSVRQGEIQLLTQIDAIAKGLNSTLDKLRADVLGQVNGPKSSRDLFIDAAALVDQIKVAQTPEDIAALTAQFDALIRQFSPEETARIGNELVSLIDQFQSAANSQLEIARANALESAESIRQLVDVFANDIADPLALIAQSNEKVAEALGLIAGTTPSEGEALPSDYDISFDESLQMQSQILSEGTQQMTDALSNGVEDMSVRLAQAIQTGFSRANVNVRVVVDSSSLVTS